MDLNLTLIKRKTKSSGHIKPAVLHNHVKNSVVLGWKHTLIVASLEMCFLKISKKYGQPLTRHSWVGVHRVATLDEVGQTIL